MDDFMQSAIECLKQVFTNDIKQFNDNKLKILRRTNHLKGGDFAVPLQKLNIIPVDLAERFLKNCQQCKSPICGATLDMGKKFLYFHLTRPDAFASILGQIEGLDRHIANGGISAAPQTRGHVVINPDIHLDDDESPLTLNHVRALFLSWHVAALLKANGYTVSQKPVRTATKNQPIIDLLNGTHRDATAHKITAHCTTAHKITAHGTTAHETTPHGAHDTINNHSNRPSKNQTRNTSLACDLFKHLKDSAYSHSVPTDSAVWEPESILVNLKQYLDDTEKQGYDCNINQMQVTMADERLINIANLNDVAEQKPSHCLHIMAHPQVFKYQQTDLLWQIVTNAPAQSHLMFRDVTLRQSSPPGQLPTAQQFYTLRYEQTASAFTMKYGEKVKGAEWSKMLHQLTLAAIKFEILSTLPTNTVKLDLCAGSGDGRAVDDRGGTFVLYNCARLSTLCQHFTTNVAAGMYGDLPPASDINFELLREEEEWSLLFNYIFPYPGLVTETVGGLAKGPKSTIQTHKICSFLCSLSRDLSSYYGRVHILTEGRAHLLPVMYARLHLMRGIQRVMHHALGLLDIEPPTQM